MSYIRSTSNPESLYIYGTKDYIEIIQGSLEGKSIPTHIWNKVFAKLKEDDSLFDSIEVDGFKIEDIIPDCSDSLKNMQKGVGIKNVSIKDRKIVMSYKDWTIEIWPVTFWEIERNVNYVLFNHSP